MATYNTEGLKDGKPLAREEGGQGSAGLYRHPESGQEAIVQTDPLFGNAQANAFIRLGFQWVRDVEPDEIKSLPELLQESENKSANNLQNLTAAVVEQNKYLSQQLEDQRKERAQVPQDATDISGERARQSAADQATARDQAHGDVAVTNTGDMEKVDGLKPSQVKKVINDGPLERPTEQPTHVGFGAPEKAPGSTADDADSPAPSEGASDEDGDEELPTLSKNTNRTDLEKIAKAEGVEVTADLDTNKKLREAIEAKRAEGDEPENAGDDGTGDSPEPEAPAAPGEGEPGTSPEEPLNDNEESRNQ